MVTKQDAKTLISTLNSVHRHGKTIIDHAMKMAPRLSPMAMQWKLTKSRWLRDNHRRLNAEILVNARRLRKDTNKKSDVKTLSSAIVVYDIIEHFMIFWNIQNEAIIHAGINDIYQLN